MALRARLIPTPPKRVQGWPFHTAKWSSVRAQMLVSGERRIDAETFLSSGFGIRSAIESKPAGWRRLGDLARAWAPPRIKIILVSPEHGVPYLNTSQVFDIRPTPRKWLAFEKTTKPETRLAAQGTILVMASASVGRPTVTTAAHDGCFISHHFLRVEPFQSEMKGWLYAFLRSPQAQAMMSGSQYASVIRHIEPHHVHAVPVPDVSEKIAADFSLRANRIIALRNEAFRLAAEADRRFAAAIGPVKPLAPPEGFSIRASELFGGRRRLEANYYTPEALALFQRFKRWEPLSNLAKRVWWMARFKRVYGRQGIPYLSADELFAINPPETKRIIVRQDDGHEKYFVHRGWIVMACSGQVYGLNGAAVLATEHNENVFFSHDLIRIIPNEAKIRSGYLLVALTHRTHGRPLLIRAAYGTSIPHLDPADVAAFPVVRIDESEEAAIADLAEQAARARSDADALERVIAGDADAIVDEFIKRPAIRLVSVEKPSRSRNDDDSANAEFESLAERWENERQRGVDVHDMVATPAYQAVIDMGHRAIRPVLLQMRNQSGHWFHALHKITAENPIPADAEGNVKRMTDAWLQWGKERGYIGDLD